jgi:hypothetical protein
MDVTNTIIPHADFGDEECCGCLVGIANGERAHIVCNECGSIIRTVPAADLQKTLNQMEIGFRQWILPKTTPCRTLVTR